MLKPTEKLKKKKDSSLKPSTYPFKKIKNLNKGPNHSPTPGKTLVSHE